VQSFTVTGANMIIDVKKGLKADLNFALGQPFLPYQQLMGVLPHRSKKIVPQAYWDLMTNPNSPIYDFYPPDFELDMNGKKQDWEAVVKIPFIDEKRLLDAMATKDGQLTSRERERNRFGVSITFSYNPEVDYVYPSSLPGIFPNLEHCQCIENIFELPTMEGLKFYKGLMGGAQLGIHARAGFPSLKFLPFHAQHGFHGVQVFQQSSRNESMVVTLSDTEQRMKVANAQQKLGKAVHVGYPFLQEAKVVKVSDELFDYTLQSGTGEVISTPLAPVEIDRWKKKADQIEQHYSKRLGIIINGVESLVHVEMLKGLKRSEDGSTVKEYGEVPGVETDFATQTIVDEVNSIDPRFVEQAAVPIEEEFPIDSKHFFLGEFAYGRPMSIAAHHDNKIEAWVLTTLKKEAEFGKQIVEQAEKLTPYMPAYHVARMLGLNPLVLSKLTASFRVKTKGVAVNLGLNLKFEAKKMKVLGYSRRSENGWEYSEKAIALIQSYMMAFPDFIATINLKPRGDLFEDTDFFPEDVAKEKIAEIGRWLKENNAREFEPVPLEAAQLDSDAVKAIEVAADEMVANTRTEPKKIGNIPRSAILNPQDADRQIGNQKFSLGDRVVYVLNKGKIPIGQTGTIVGITRTHNTDFLDVVFDTRVMSGSSLGDRCSPFRGATVLSNSVLNLSNRQLLALTKNQADKTQTAQKQSVTVQSKKPYGVTQFVPANVPQPLTNSFAGALSDETNGKHSESSTRGRGGGSAYAGKANGVSSSRGNGRGANLSYRGPRGGQSGQSENRSANRGRGRGVDENASNGVSQRGRGQDHKAGATPAPNRDGYMVTDLENPMEGVVEKNPNFRPQRYGNVAPPSSLQEPNRPRGRGRAHGFPRGPRGGNYRGRGNQQTQQS
jgi:5'-3' exoribonuclease 1